MILAPNQTKLVCAIDRHPGHPESCGKYCRPGLNIARVNCSHSDLAWQETRIRT
jgi:pyruvate kinase